MNSLMTDYQSILIGGRPSITDGYLEPSRLSNQNVCFLSVLILFSKGVQK